MINSPTITISRNIFDDINTWLDLHGEKDIVIVNIVFTSRVYIINYNTTTEYKEICIPIEDIKQISHEKNKAFQLEQLKKK